MSAAARAEIELLQRLPLPLAHLYRRAQNAKTPLDRHLMAMALWEAALKLLGSTAVVRFARMGQPDEKLSDRIRRLSRPGLGDWWALVRALLPVLGDSGDGTCRQAAELLLAGRRHDDLPKAAGLDVVLVEVLKERK